jgi:outer membrane protein TolC
MRSRGLGSQPPYCPSALLLYCLIALFAVAIVLPLGCKSAAPPPPREEVVREALPETTEIPDEFKAAKDVDTGQVDDGWIRGFGDPQLEALVDEALHNNLNLRIAAAQVDSAAAAAIQAGARLKPTLDLALGAAGSGTSSVSSGEGVVGLSSTWEVDVWGKLASGTAAAEASFRATQADYEFGRQSLAAQTAKGWFLATQTHMLLDLALETVDLFEQTLELVETKQEVGQVTMQDVHLASADLCNRCRRRCRLACRRSCSSAGPI